MIVAVRSGNRRHSAMDIAPVPPATSSRCEAPDRSTRLASSAAGPREPACWARENIAARPGSLIPPAAKLGPSPDTSPCTPAERC